VIFYVFFMPQVLIFFTLLIFAVLSIRVNMLITVIILLISAALFVSGRTRTVRRRTGDECTGIAVAPRKTASAAVRTRQSRSYETYARILLNRKILVRNGERKRGNRTHTRNNSYRNQNSSHLFSSLISTC
jgi:hypothetical protein